MSQNPKKNLTNLTLKHGYWGNRQRIENTMEALDTNVVFPKCVEYEDIDRAVLEFFRDNIDLMADGKKAPTFTLFSNQRFSEYSQTWEHTDEEGNLLMDFKTVNREPNPSWGDNQGGDYNIPGDRRYTIQMKEVLDDNGTESYEVHSMGQPLSVNLEYTLNFVTADWSKLNDFNIQLNQLFKSIQCYIKPNGWYMPMKLEGINDDTEYAVDNRKIYIQSASISVVGIVLPKSSYKIERFPKRKFFSTDFDMERNRTYVDIEETGSDDVNINMYFGAKIDKIQFTFDDDVEIKKIEKDNIRDYSITINGERRRFPENGFSLHNGDEVKIKIYQIDKNIPSTITFSTL